MVVSPIDTSRRVPATVRVQISRGCGVPATVTVVAPTLPATTLIGADVGAGAIAKAARHRLPSRLTIASCRPSAKAVSAAGPLLLMSCAKLRASASSVGLPLMGRLIAWVAPFGPASVMVQTWPLVALLSNCPMKATGLLLSMAKPLTGLTVSCGARTAPPRSEISTLLLSTAAV